MDLITAWFGFVGAWVLVAGPVYQGALELGELRVDLPAIRAQMDTVPRPGRISPWWWLLPPAAYVLVSRNRNVWQKQVMAALTPQQRVDFVTYSDKSAGWFIVGAGAALIGVQQAVGLVEAFGWPGLAAIPLIAVAAGLAAGYTVVRIELSQRALQAAAATG